MTSGLKCEKCGAVDNVDRLTVASAVGSVTLGFLDSPCIRLWHKNFVYLVRENTYTEKYDKIAAKTQNIGFDLEDSKTLEKNTLEWQLFCFKLFEKYIKGEV